MSRRAEAHMLCYMMLTEVRQLKPIFYTNDPTGVSCNFQPLSLRRTSRMIPANRFILGTLFI